MPLRHDSDLTTVRARSRTDVALDHGPVPFLHNHGSEFAALTGRRLVPPGPCTLRQDPLESFPKLCIEYAVDDRVEGRVAVAEPSEYLFADSYTHVALSFLASLARRYPTGRGERLGNAAAVGRERDSSSAREGRREERDLGIETWNVVLGTPGLICRSCNTRRRC